MERRKRRNRVGVPRRTSKRGRAWRKMVKRYGVKKGAKIWRRRRRKPKRASAPRRRRRVRRRRVRRKARRRRNYAANPRRRRRTRRRKTRRRRNYAANPRRRKRRRKTRRRRNPVTVPAAVRRLPVVGGLAATMREVVSVENVKDAAFAGLGLLSTVGIPGVLTFNGKFLGLVDLTPKSGALIERVKGYVPPLVTGVIATSVAGRFLGKRRAKMVGLGVGLGLVLRAALESDAVRRALRIPAGFSLGNSEEDEIRRAVEEEVRRELSMSDYATPGGVVSAESLGMSDYATPGGVVAAEALGEFGQSGEFGEGADEF